MARVEDPWWFIFYGTYPLSSAERRRESILVSYFTYISGFVLIDRDVMMVPS